MGILSWFKRDDPKAALKEGLTIEQFAELLQAANGGAVSKSGIPISPDTAMRMTTVMICIRVLAESVASLPCILYRRRKDGGRDRATDHPLYHVLHDQANGWNTAFEYLEGTMTNLATRGNGYSYIDRNYKGQVISLVPLNPDGVAIKQAVDWSPIYTATMPDNTRIKLAPGQMHHIRGPFVKGYTGRSMIAMAREAIALGLAAEEFGARFFSNGATPSGSLKHPKTLSQPAQDRLKLQFEQRLVGLENASKPLLLEEGMEWIQHSINQKDAQFLETRKFQRSEIAGIFRVPAHFVNDLDRATFSNIEHQSLDFVIHSLRPWLKRWEQAINRDLLSDDEKSEYYAEFLIDDLLRGDFKTRMEAFALQIQNGIRNPNEVRAIENLNSREGGDEYWQPVNMQTGADKEAAAALAEKEQSANDNKAPEPFKEAA